MFLGSFSERTILFNERKKELFVAFFFFAVFEIIYFKRRLSVSRRAATMKKQQRYDIFSYFFSFVRLFTTFKTDARCFPCHCIWALKHFLFDDDDNGSNKCSFTYVAIIIFQIFSYLFISLTFFVSQYLIWILQMLLILLSVSHRVGFCISLHKTRTKKLAFCCWLSSNNNSNTQERKRRFFVSVGIIRKKITQMKSISLYWLSHLNLLLILCRIHVRPPPDLNELQRTYVLMKYELYFFGFSVDIREEKPRKPTKGNQFSQLAVACVYCFFFHLLLAAGGCCSIIIILFGYLSRCHSDTVGFIDTRINLRFHNFLIRSHTQSEPDDFHSTLCTVQSLFFNRLCCCCCYYFFSYSLSCVCCRPKTDSELSYICI